MAKPVHFEAMPLRADRERLKVFISYSRDDARFAAEVLAGLDFDGGFETLIDSHSIHEGEEWKARISNLIAEAGTFVAILSPRWLASEICKWELAEAWRHSKRVVPVQYGPLTGLEIPPRLSAINYVRFDQNTDGTPRLLMDGMTALRRALVTDIGWVREHARLMSKAAEWDSAGRVSNRMLAGSDISAAKEWLEKRPTGAPDPTELHRDYIAASEQAESLRLSQERQRAETLHRAYVRARRALIAASAAGIVAGVAFFYAYAKKLEVQRSEERATRERDAALVVQSRHLSDIAGRQADANDVGTAMLLTLAGLPDHDPQPVSRPRGAANAPTRPYVAAVEGQLYRSLFETHERALLAGHDGPVLGLWLSSDGTSVITGGSDQTLRAWTHTGQQGAVRKIEDGAINAVAVTPDNRILVATASKVLVLERDTGKPVRTLTGQIELIRALAVSQDGERIVTGSDDKTARVYDAATGELVAELAGHAGPVTSIAVSKDGNIVVTGSGDSTAIVWDVVTRRPAMTIKEHALAISSVALSINSKVLVTGAADKSVRVWETATGKPVAAVTGLDRAVTSVALSPEGLRMIAGFEDGTIRFYTIETGTEVERFAGHMGEITQLAISADGQRIVSASKDGTARVWSVAAGPAGGNFEGHDAAVTSVAVGADGSRVLTGSRDLTARVWDTGAAKPALLTQLGADVIGVAITSDGTRAVTGSSDRRGRVWDIESRKVIAELTGHNGAVLTVAVSADGRFAATGSEDMTARIWNATTGVQISATQPLATRLASVAFSPDGSRFITGAGTTARVWDAEKGEQIAVFMGHTGSVLAVAMSPDGRLAASGGRDATVRLWDLTNGEAPHVLRGQDGAATSLVFSADSRRILAGWSDGHIRIWDTRTGDLVASIRMRDAAISSLALAARTGQVVIGFSDGSARIAPLFPDTAMLVERAKATAPRCLTRTQLEQFHLGVPPPRWCITGAGRERETDAQKWQPLWPYRGTEWRNWQAAIDRGESPALPE